MTIRGSDKNHLRTQLKPGEAAPLVLVSAGVVTPTPTDELVFWTQHTTKPAQVDLREFAAGKHHKRMGYANEKTFTGRPQLIKEFLPLLKEKLQYAPKTTVAVSLSWLRYWWALMDSVEESAKALTTNTGSVMERVQSVAHLTTLHRAAAAKAQMAPEAFSAVRLLVDQARKNLELAPTYWQPIERQTQEKYLPPLEHREAVRHALRRECLRVIDRWDECDVLAYLETGPVRSEPFLWPGLRHLRQTQRRTGRVLPSLDDLNNLNSGGYRSWCKHYIGMHPTAILQAGFASRADALAVFSQCMAVTGWNLAVMMTLDVTTDFLIDHPSDNPQDPSCRFMLTGVKERAGGALQLASGPWKTSYLAGSLIRRYLKRVEPLRRVLIDELKALETPCETAEVKSEKETKQQVDRIIKLRQACRSVWLYVDVDGKAAALDETGFVIDKSEGTDGKRQRITYLDRLLARLNESRKRSDRDALAHYETPGAQCNTAEPAMPPPKPPSLRDPIQGVTYGDFRLWFGDYLLTSSFGNLLMVQLGLGHKRLTTTQGYVDTNLANGQAQDQVRGFMEALTAELDAGRLDPTILAHKTRFGGWTAEQQIKLDELRKLAPSRQGVRCKNPLKPPPHMNSTSGKPCQSQRCLLCKEHAVLLPESLDGIAMREAELLTMRQNWPQDKFIKGRYDEELLNQQAALSLEMFDPQEVEKAREKWAQAIATGAHLVPGMAAVGAEGTVYPIYEEARL